MRLILYSQYYRARTPERQAELDYCLRSNLQHPALDQVVLLREPDAPPQPGPARMPVEEIEEAERFTYASWMRLVQQQRDAIGILLNADIALGEGIEQLEQVLSTPDSVMALSRYNPQAGGLPPLLNKFPHWTQDTWALRTDAPIADSLLYASSFPIGFPGCDNRIAYVFWSHGLQVKNPCYFVQSLHHQADERRAYDKNGDRLYGGVSYVHPTLALADQSELEHTIWTRSHDRCPGVLVNQQAVEQGVHQLLAKDGDLAQRFLEQQKSTALAWSFPPLGGSSSAFAVAVPIHQAVHDGHELELHPTQRLKGLQLRLPQHSGVGWRVAIEGQQSSDQTLRPLDLEERDALPADGQRYFLEGTALSQPWQRLRLKLLPPPIQSPGEPEGLLEVLAFCEGDRAEATTPKPAPAQTKPAASKQPGRPLQLRLRQRRLEPKTKLNLDSWSTLYRWSSRFVLLARDGRIAFVDRYWLTAATFADPELQEWDSRALRDGFLWGFAGPVLEWRLQQFSTEKLYAEQLHFWQYPCRTEQDAFERHQRMEAPYWDGEGVHLYVGMPWATWIDKKTFPDELLEAYRSRIKAMAAILREPLQVHSVCQHIRWKEHPHRFEQAGINQLWIAHKEKGWDTEGQLRLHSWPLYAVNVLDPERREGLEIVPVEKKTIFASFKGAHMKHYPSDIRLRLKELAHLEGYEIEVTDLWHFNKVVYNYQISNKTEDKEAIEKEVIRSYNQLLSRTLFSLCPAGAGPNTLRLWESLGTGSIPVILSDNYELPTLPDRLKSPSPTPNWEDALIVCSENNISSLNEILKGISLGDSRIMQQNCQKIFRDYRSHLCFGSPTATRSLPASLATESPSHVNSGDALSFFARQQRILVLGSSVSIQKEGYLPLLKSRLNSMLADGNTEHYFLNASLGGTNVYATLAYTAGNLFYDIDSFAPTVAIIEKGPNNRILDMQKLSPAEAERRVKSTVESIQRLIRLLLAKNCCNIMCITAYIADACINWQSIDSEQSHIAYIDSTACSREGILHLNLAARIDQLRKSGCDELLLDDVHLNKNGAEVCSQLIVDMLQACPIDQMRSTSNTCSSASIEVVSLQGPKEIWQNSLVSTSYTSVETFAELPVSDGSGKKNYITGIFFVADSESPFIRIESDTGESFRTCLFDHHCYMRRLHFRVVPRIGVLKSFKVFIEPNEVNYESALNQYRCSKIFDPYADWAKQKYETPLLESAKIKKRVAKLVGFVIDHYSGSF